MKLTAITLADEKFMPLAHEQAENFKRFGIKNHVIIPIKPATYGHELWMQKLQTNIDAVKEYGRVFKCDAEVRLVKSFPDEWNDNENVLWHITPPTAIPFNIPINSGQMILGKSSLPFLECLLEMTQAFIPMTGVHKDTEFMFSPSMQIDDELMFAPALKMSKLKYHVEELRYDRNDRSRSNRGNWINRDTVLLHPFIHTWETVTHRTAEWFFTAHFAPTQSKAYVDAVLLGLKMHLINGYAEDRYWQKLGAEQSRVLRWKLHDWHFTPPSKYLPNGLICPEGHTPKPFLTL